MMHYLKNGRPSNALAKVLLCILVFVLPIAGSASDSTLKVIMEINSMTFDVTLRGLRSAQEILDQAKADGNKVDLRIMVCGPALDRFQTSADTELRKNFEKLSNLPEVHFLACESTLKKIRSKPDNLLPGFTVVKSGAYEVLTLEKNGYFYIKP